MGNQISNDSNSPLHKQIEDSAYFSNDQTVRQWACQNGIVWQQRNPFLVVPSNINDLNNLNANQKIDMISKTLRIADMTGFTQQGTTVHSRAPAVGEGQFSLNTVGENLVKCNIFGHNYSEGRCTAQDVLTLEGGYNTVVTARKAAEAAELNRQAAENTAQTTVETNQKALQLLDTQIEIAQKSVEETVAEAEQKFEEKKEEIEAQDREKIKEQVEVSPPTVSSKKEEEEEEETEKKYIPPVEEEDFFKKNFWFIIGGGVAFILLILIIVILSSGRQPRYNPMMMQQPMMMPQQMMQPMMQQPMYN